jgi:putative transposase
MLKAIKIRLYPTTSQTEEMNKLLGSCRFVYNYCLALKIDSYKKDKISLNTTQLNKEIIRLKNTEDFHWLKEVHSKVIQQSLLNLDMAYKNFFRNKNGFPKFKSKGGVSSCRFPIDAIIGINGNRISLITKLKNIHFKCSVRDEKFLNKKNINLKSATLSKTKSGHYILSILVENTLINDNSNNMLDKIIGIDLGIKDFVICSDGTRYENLKIIRSNQKKLSRLQRQISKKVKGSNNRNKARIKLALFNNKLKNKKEYYLHHVVNSLLDENQVIAMEDLNVSGMMKNHKLARSIQELSLGEFSRILKYKANWQEKQIIEVNRWFPSSKLCSNCNHKNNDLKLKDRNWICKNCNVINDRDHNASTNIHVEGLRIINELNIGLSKPEFTLVENSSVDDPASNGMLKSICSMKQEDKVVRLVNVSFE